MGRIFLPRLLDVTPLLMLYCREPRIHSLVAQGKITLHKFKGTAYFNRDEIGSLARLHEYNWSMDQAVIETELSRYQLKQLLDAGLVKALQKADHQNRDWLICKNSWIRLISRCQKSAQENLVAQGKTLSGFQKQGFPITKLFELILKNLLIYNFATSQSKPYSFRQIINFKITNDLRNT